jgi:hypothetical protein
LAVGLESEEVEEAHGSTGFNEDIEFEVAGDGDEHEEEGGADEEEEGHEGVVVVHAHAVVHPRTMVVESLHAFVADAAVTRPLCTDHFAVRTEQHRVKTLQQVLESLLISNLPGRSYFWVV